MLIGSRTAHNPRLPKTETMLRFLCLALLFMSACGQTDTPEVMLFDFSASAPAWDIEDDTVMGGRSQGHLELTAEGHAHFYGEISLENDGGFSSIHRRLRPQGNVAEQEAFLLRLRGDGKSYTLRVQARPEENYFYQASFPTSGEWETVRVPFQEMSAFHHGKPVDVPNYESGSVQTLQLLFGNQRAEDFDLLIDWIGAE